MAIKVEVTDEQCDEIVVQSLNDAIQHFEEAFEDRANDDGGLNYAHFSTNIQEDLAEIQKHIEAFKTVKSYYHV